MIRRIGNSNLASTLKETEAEGGSTARDGGALCFNKTQWMMLADEDVRSQQFGTRAASHWISMELQ